MQSEQEYIDRIKELESKVNDYEKDPRKEAYYTYKLILDQQVTFLKNFKIKDEIAKTVKEDATYARAKDMWKELPDMIREMGVLSTELKIDDSKNNEEKLVPVTPQSIAKGQNV
jgi:hypothetical protein